MHSPRVVACAFIIALVAVALIYLWMYENGVRSNAMLDSNFMVARLSVESYNISHLYYAYLAYTAQQQEEGYMNATGIGDCDGYSPCLGMLFVFQNYSDQCFWMKNTGIPLAQVWFTGNGTAFGAVYEYNATPYDLQPVCYNGTMVLETAPGHSIRDVSSIRIDGILSRG